jgi:H+/gluconate symporter-like permease
MFLIKASKKIVLGGSANWVYDRKPSLRNDPIPPRLWTLLHLSQYAAFILSIVFTTTGREDLSYASAVIVACLFVVLVGILVVFYFGLRRAPAGSTGSSTNSSDPEEEDNTFTTKQLSSDEETRKSTLPILPNAKTKTLLNILLASTPFLAVRVTYMLLATFTHDSVFTGRELDDSPNTGSWTTAEMEAYILPNVYVVAFMQYSMEIVVFGLFVGAETARKEQDGDETQIEMGDTTRSVGRGQCRV